MATNRFRKNGEIFTEGRNNGKVILIDSNETIVVDAGEPAPGMTAQEYVDHFFSLIQQYFGTTGPDFDEEVQLLIDQQWSALVESIGGELI